MGEILINEQLYIIVELQQHQHVTSSVFLSLYWVAVFSSKLMSSAYYKHVQYTRKCTTLWGEPGRIQVQNMELQAYDRHQNVTEPQATENHIKYTQEL